MQIYQLNDEDLPDIYQIESKAHQYPWSYQTMSNTLFGHYTFFGLKKDNHLIGFVVLQFIVDEAQILNLCIHPDFQSIGLGRQLLAETIEKTKHLKMKKVFLEVRISNQKSQKLYQSQGFKIIAVRKNYYQTNQKIKEDALVMKLTFEKNSPPKTPKK